MVQSAASLTTRAPSQRHCAISPADAIGDWPWTMPLHQRMFDQNISSQTEELGCEQVQTMHPYEAFYPLTPTPR